MFTNILMMCKNLSQEYVCLIYVEQKQDQNVIWSSVKELQKSIEKTNCILF